jgi:3-isopropylmalate/(R)-2-methylmalate dehydratase large subunit
LTTTEKILARASGNEKVIPGEIINVAVDLVLANDITAPLAIKNFKETGATKVFDPSKIVLVPDHFVPNKDIQAAEQCSVLRQFARDQKTLYYEVGVMGIEHALLPEQGLVSPGMVIVGADSHTCTYGALNAFATGVGSTDVAVAMATGDIWLKVPQTMRIIYSGKPSKWVVGKDIMLHTIGVIGVDGARYMAMEFSGEPIDELSIDSRLSMANMAIEAGAKNGMFKVDDKTRQYLNEHPPRRAGKAKAGVEVWSDTDAEFAQDMVINIDDMEPQVARPHLPSNVFPVSEVKEKIDQVVIGSCTNGRIEDLRIAASILKDKKVNENIRAIIIPATQQIYLQALREGLIETFIKANAAVSTPTCGPCLGGHMGILAEGEKAVATTNRNFVGRMGHPKSEVYLSSPAVAAASAVTGYITHPEEVA